MPTALATLMDRNTAITRRDRYEKIRAKLWTDRNSFDEHWTEIANFLMPRRTRFWSSDRNRGDKRNQHIIDSTGRFAVRTLRAGMHSGISSPARPWLKLSLPDKELARFKPVAEWLHSVTERVLEIYADSNLYNVLPLTYGDMGLFGTSTMSLLEDSEDLFRAYQYPIGSFAVGLDYRNKVTTFVYEYELTVRQVVEQFGLTLGGRAIDWSRLSTTIKNLWDQGDYEQAVEICWIVQPNDYFTPGAFEAARAMRWASVHFEKGESDGRVLRESGFESFPIMGPRWEAVGTDAYGVDCPGMTALGDVKQLQAQARAKGQFIQKVVKPPLVGPSIHRTQKVSQLPGDLTIEDIRTGQAGLRPIHELQLAGLQYLTQDIQDVRYLIQRAFYEDLFLMLAASDQQLGADRPTAREIDERHEEKMLALGPVLEQVNDELLDPMVDRTIKLMNRYGLLPPPPPDIRGQRLTVEYTSILHQAQKLAGVAVQDRFIQSVIAMSEASPSVLEKVDWFETVDRYGDQLGVDPRIIRSTEDAEARLAEAAKQQKALADAQVAKDLAGAAAQAGAQPVAPDSALDRITQGLAG